LGTIVLPVSLPAAVANDARDSAVSAIGHTLNPLYASGARALAIQPDGRIVVAGSWSTTERPYGPPAFALARYKANGRLDPSFGLHGTLLTGFGLRGANATDLALQPNGRIVVVGTSTMGDPVTTNDLDFVVARYLPDGRLDPKFGSRGKVHTKVTGSDNAAAMALQPDGKIVVAGSGGVVTSPTRFVLVRYLQNGRLDPAFGVAGKVVTDFGHRGFSYAVASRVFVESDGKMLLAGIVEPATSGLDVALVWWAFRLNYASARKLERIRQCCADGNHTMIAEQAGLPPFECYACAVG
jgi:uncharacterized delta-60 repeat protein